MTKDPRISQAATGICPAFPLACFFLAASERAEGRDRSEVTSAQDTQTG